MNSVFVRGNKLIDNIVRFCKPLTSYNPGSEYELSFVGTCCLARYRQKLVQVTEFVGNLDDPENMSFEGYLSRFSKLYQETSRTHSMPAHIEFRTHRDHSMTLTNYDDLSGSPVFCLYEDDNRQSHLGFGGMIRLAGNNIFRVDEGRYIKQVLDWL